jgi:predicted unusual protein kinase regulating ubiquinone biosynthesis (AarF/ABC1/UbiB family)
LEENVQLKEQIALQYINTHSNSYKKPSGLYVLRVLMRLLPIIIALRKDRRKWVKSQGKGIDEEAFRRHARRIVATFIELGPSYIKLGQWLSTRADMLPMPYLEELAKLQDDVPPADFSQVRPTIEKELGKLEDVFDSFNPRPLSGASLGQVYTARYLNQDVVVKVGRPHIEEQVERDIHVLQKILPFATKFIDPNLRFSAEGMLSQFIETIHEEMDYRTEAENLATIRKNLAGDASVTVPRVFSERTSQHVITMEYLPGIKITDVAALDAMGIDREQLVVQVHKLFFKMLLRHNIFHADPHPGNISVADDGTIILYDFGMVGRLDNQTRLRLVRLYLALVDKDSSRTVNVLMELGTLEQSVNRYFVEKAVDMSIQSMYGKEVDKMEVRALMELSNKTMSRFPFRLPKNLALYMRMASILEGIYLHHKVKFQFIKVLADLLKEEGLVTEAYVEEAKTSLLRFAKGIETFMTIGTSLQQTALDILQGRSDKFQRSTFLTSVSILAAGLFVGSALVYPHDIWMALGLLLGGIAAAAASFYRKRGTL